MRLGTTPGRLQVLDLMPAGPQVLHGLFGPVDAIPKGQPWGSTISVGIGFAATTGTAGCRVIR